MMLEKKCCGPPPHPVLCAARAPVGNQMSLGAPDTALAAWRVGFVGKAKAKLLLVGRSFGSFSYTLSAI